MLDTDIQKILEDYCNNIHSGSKEKAAQALGVSTPTFWRWLTMKARPKIETLIPIFEALDLSITSNKAITSKTETTDNEEIQSIGVHVVAGAGNAWELTESNPILNIDIPIVYLNKSDFAVVVSGESMYPTIKNNAVVGIKEKVDFTNNEIYLIRIQYEGLVVKRLLIDYDKKKYIIKSDNLDKNQYPNIEINMEEAENIIIGRVMWVWQNV